MLLVVVIPPISVTLILIVEAFSGALPGRDWFTGRPVYVTVRLVEEPPTTRLDETSTPFTATLIPLVLIPLVELAKKEKVFISCLRLMPSGETAETTMGVDNRRMFSTEFASPLPVKNRISSIHPEKPRVLSNRLPISRFPKPPKSTG